MNNCIAKELIDKFDHVKVVSDGPVYFVHFYLTDGTMEEYGPYNTTKEAYKVHDKIIDMNVINKYPFLAKPLTADNINLDAAIHLSSELIRDAKISYIHQARILKSHGLKIPTSVKEYRALGIDKEIHDRLEKVIKCINDILDIPEDERTELDNELLEKFKNERISLESRGWTTLLRDIEFVEKGCNGALGLLKSGISGEDVLIEWKKEALGYK